MLIRRHAGSPSAPKRMASNSSRSISTRPRQRNALAQILVRAQSNRQIPEAAWREQSRLFSTFTACGVTSAPMPSPGITGDSHRGTATSQRNARQSLASSTAGFAPSAKLRDMERLSFRPLQSSRPAILPPKAVCAPALPGASEVLRAAITFTMMPCPIQSNRRRERKNPPST